MLYEEFTRIVTKPYWVPNPLVWHTMVDVGIAFFAKEGRVGMFNLSWLMLNVDRPPPPSVYHSRDLGWIVVNASKLEVGGATLEHQASMLPLWAFCDMLKADRATRHSLVLRCLLLNGLKKLEHDPRLHGTSR